MTRIHTPASIETSPGASRPLLEAVETQLGSVPNLFRVVGNSPAALEGYLGVNAALGKGRIDLRTRERIALIVAESNDARIVEIVLHVALNTLTNYVNAVARTEIDFPAIGALRAA